MIAMNLNTRFRLLMICMITLPVSMAVIMAIGVQYTKVHIRQAVGMDELVLNLHELQILNSEYVSTPSERVIQQWRTKFDQISKKLAKQRGIPDGVEDALHYLPQIFEPLITLPDAASGKEVFHKRFRSQAAATLNLESQRIMDWASDMSRREQEGIVPLLLLIGAIMFVLMLLVSLTAMTIMLVTTRHILSSVNLLKDGASAIAGGSLGFQVKHRGNDELASLASAINQMSHSLMASYEDLQKQKVRLETEMAERQTIHENLTIKTVELGREIKEHRRAEEALRESKERLSTLFHCSPIPIWEEDFTCVKERFDALRTDGVCDWRRYFEEHPDIVSECVGLVRLLDVNETSVTFFQAGSKANLNRNLAHYFTDESLAVFKEELITLAEGGTSFESEILIRNLKGETQAIWFTLKVDPSRTEKLDRVLVSFFDITERKKAEEEKAKLQSQLLQSQKIESVGRLAGGVAHDFNNMLGVILGHAEMALDQVGPFLPLKADLQEICKAAGRSADLTRQLLAFARQQTVEPKVLDLNEIVENVLKMLQRLIGEDIQLLWHPKTNLWPVKMDPTQIDQILANLCINARDAISDTGIITIETGNIGLNEAFCADHVDFSPGEYVMLIVSDDGSGMDKETTGKIFDPFFTTKGSGKGTGLGLATVYGIVKQNNGFIDVHSEPEHGTTFTIYLPRFLGQSEQAQMATPKEPLVRGQETVLMVEDEQALLDLNRIILEKQGYRVLAAGSPPEAIRMAGEYTGEIHLLMTDVVMPEMNGRDLAKHLLSLNPHLKCLFTSGYTADVIAHHGVLDAGVYFIQKPFSRKDLAAKVREVLDQK